MFPLIFGKLLKGFTKKAFVCEPFVINVFLSVFCAETINMTTSVASLQTKQKIGD